MPAKAATSNKKEAQVAKTTPVAATKKPTSKSPVRSKSPAPKGKQPVEESKVAPAKGKLNRVYLCHQFRQDFSS